MAGVRVIDRGWKRAMQACKILDGKGVKVGILAGAGQDPEGTDLVEIAAYNEFGTDTAPSRPFIRTTADEIEKGPMQNYAGRLVKGMLGGTISPTVVLDSLGMWVVQRMRSKVRKSPSWAVANSPKTIAAKGSSVPLIEHGSMVRAIDYEKT